MALFARPGRVDTLDGMVDYLVDTPDGPVGIVDGWERDGHGRPQSLIVAQGWFGRRRLEIPLDALLEIDHEERRIVLVRGAAPLEPKGRLQRLVDPGQRGSGEVHAAAAPRSPAARPVLCGVADDRHASAVVAVAARLATTLSAPLILVHITPAQVPPGVSAAPDGQARLREEEAEHAHALIDGLLSPLVASTDARRIVARGTPAGALEELAHTEGAQLLVIGSTGKGPLGALLKGSVSQHVIGHSSCPVVVVPPEVPPRLREGDDDQHADVSHLAGLGTRRVS